MELLGGPALLLLASVLLQVSVLHTAARFVAIPLDSSASQRVVQPSAVRQPVPTAQQPLFSAVQQPLRVPVFQQTFPSPGLQATQIFVQRPILSQPNQVAANFAAAVRTASQPKIIQSFGSSKRVVPTTFSPLTFTTPRSIVTSTSRPFVATTPRPVVKSIFAPITTPASTAVRVQFVPIQPVSTTDKPVENFVHKENPLDFTTPTVQKVVAPATFQFTFPSEVIGTTIVNAQQNLKPQFFGSKNEVPKDRPVFASPIVVTPAPVAASTRHGPTRFVTLPDERETGENLLDVRIQDVASLVGEPVTSRPSRVRVVTTKRVKGPKGQSKVVSRVTQTHRGPVRASLAGLQEEVDVHPHEVHDVQTPVPEHRRPENQEQVQTLVESKEEVNVDEETERQAQEAAYSFKSAIEDPLSDLALSREERREGGAVEGSYSYSDGFVRRTVHYRADHLGFRILSDEREAVGEGPVPDPEGLAEVSVQTSSGVNSHYTVTAQDIHPRNKHDTAEELH